MTTLELPGEINTAFDHLAAYGLAAILERSGAASPRIAWSDELDSHPRLERALPWEEAARAVRAHAQRAASQDSWVRRTKRMGNGKSESGLFSPRVSKPSEDDRRERFEAWYSARSIELDALMGSHLTRRLDLEFIGALGEPSYWQENQDHGSSAWDMGARQVGSDFVKTRLRELAVDISNRDEELIEQGLRSEQAHKEDKRDDKYTRLQNGLMAPTYTSLPRTWCALWGLSLTWVSHQARRPSSTAGHSGESIHLPVATSALPLSRLRSVLSSIQLRRAASSTKDTNPGAESRTKADWMWLREHGVTGVLTAPIARPLYDKASERWIERGKLIVVRL